MGDILRFLCKRLICYVGGLHLKFCFQKNNVLYWWVIFEGFFSTDESAILVGLYLKICFQKIKLLYWRVIFEGLFSTDESAILVG